MSSPEEVVELANLTIQKYHEGYDIAGDVEELTLLAYDHGVLKYILLLLGDEDVAYSQDELKEVFNRALATFDEDVVNFMLDYYDPVEWIERLKSIRNKERVDYILNKVFYLKNMW